MISNGCNKVAFDILMFSSSDLFQFRDAFRELSKTSVGVKDGKTEVNLSRANSMNTPLCIVIPKHLVPVVKRLQGENFRRVRKRPITPKWAMYTIETIDHGLLNICEGPKDWPLSQSR